MRASQWDVTYADDDDIFGIFSSFFAWDHYSWRFFDEDLFFEGLLQGGSDFCSKVLVHAILAFGAVSRDSVEFDRASISEDIFAE